MAMDIRLDFISDIDPIEIERMKEVRAKIIEIDDELKKIINEINNPAGLRAASLARTHLEIALQFAIKSLCILGELE